MSDSVIEKIKKAREEANRDKKEAADLAQKIPNWILLLQLAEKEDRATRERLKNDLVEAQQGLTQNRLHENPTVRRAVWKALISWHIHPQLSTKEDAENIVARLLEEDLVKEDPAGTMAILGKSYSASPDSQFEEVDVEEMEQQFSLFQSRFRAMLKKTGNTSVKKLVEREKGHFCLFVPPEKYTTPEGPKWRPGGTLILESDGRFVKALDAIGKIEGVLAEFRKLEAKKLWVKIEVASLQWQQPPLLPFANDDEKERSKKTQVLWYMIKRGMGFADWVAKTSIKGKLTGREFFIEKKPGAYFLDLEEAWQDRRAGKDPLWISRPVVLLERSTKDGATGIQILEIPPHLTDWLAECCEFSFEGHQFDGLNQPLQNILRHCYGKALRDTEKQIAVEAAEEICATLP